jgi:hypothetical protein
MRRFRKFVKCFVEPVLPAQDGSKNEMQQSAIRRSIVRSVAKQRSNFVFSRVEVLVVNQSGNLGRPAGAAAGSNGS